jgi:Na+-driven multidrug efflux pump
MSWLPQKHRKILKLSIPAAINSLLDMLQIITDLIMVGRISAFAVAAVGLGLQSLMFVFACDDFVVLSRFLCIYLVWYRPRSHYLGS